MESCGDNANLVVEHEHRIGVDQPDDAEQQVLLEISLLSRRDLELRIDLRRKIGLKI